MPVTERAKLSVKAYRLMKIHDDLYIF
jgi:hypothetical protein